MFNAEPFPSSSKTLLYLLAYEKDAVFPANPVEFVYVLSRRDNQPCITCAKMIINSGIVRAVCANSYPDELSRGMLDEADVTLEVWETPSNTVATTKEE